MRNIANFFTLFWIIYYPTCIAFNDLPGFSNIDEIMTVVLMFYTFVQYKSRAINKKTWKEYIIFLFVLTFYLIYSLQFGRNESEAVWLDLVQQIRPFSIIYCTMILDPQFSSKQKGIIIKTMVATLVLWIVYHLETIESSAAEFPVLGQLAISTGMVYYLFTKDTAKNHRIALLIVLTGMLAPKFKFLGEVVCFVALVYFLKGRLNFKSPKTVLYLLILVGVIIFVTWSRFDNYYVSGLDNDNLARPMTYKTSLKILSDYFPFGSGMGSFATAAAAKVYSPIYYEYHLSEVWGLGGGGKAFISDAFYPSLAQFGVVGVLLFVCFWKRRLHEMNNILDKRYYRMAFMTFFCLAIEQTADSSWLSGKGMGYCMILALCLNANRHLMSVHK